MSTKSHDLYTVVHLQDHLLTLKTTWQTLQVFSRGFVIVLYCWWWNAPWESWMIVDVCRCFFPYSSNCRSLCWWLSQERPKFLELWLTCCSPAQRCYSHASVYNAFIVAIMLKLATPLFMIRLMYAISLWTSIMFMTDYKDYASVHLCSCLLSCSCSWLLLCLQ